MVTQNENVHLQHLLKICVLLGRHCIGSHKHGEGKKKHYKSRAAVSGKPLTFPKTEKKKSKEVKAAAVLAACRKTKSISNFYQQQQQQLDDVRGIKLFCNLHILGI